MSNNLSDLHVFPALHHFVLDAAVNAPADVASPRPTSMSYLTMRTSNASWLRVGGCRERSNGCRINEAYFQRFPDSCATLGGLAALAQTCRLRSAKSSTPSTSGVSRRRIRFRADKPWQRRPARRACQLARRPRSGPAVQSHLGPRQASPAGRGSGGPNEWSTVVPDQRTLLSGMPRPGSSAPPTLWMRTAPGSCRRADPGLACSPAPRTGPVRTYLWTRRYETS